MARLHIFERLKGSHLKYRSRMLPVGLVCRSAGSDGGRTVLGGVLEELLHAVLPDIEGLAVEGIAFTF